MKLEREQNMNTITSCNYELRVSQLDDGLCGSNEVTIHVLKHGKHLGWCVMDAGLFITGGDAGLPWEADSKECAEMLAELAAAAEYDGDINDEEEQKRRWSGVLHVASALHVLATFGDK